MSDSTSTALNRASATPPAPTLSGKTVAELFDDGTSVGEPTSTRDRLIEAALGLFYQYGFHAVGLDRILADVGISKQAFYKHFPSKDDLAVEAIRLRDRRESAAFMRQVLRRATDGDGGAEPRRVLLAMFDVLDDWFNHPDYTGCLFLTACAEFPSPHDPIHQAAAAHSKASLAEMCRLAEAAGADEPAALAGELKMLIAGAITDRLVLGDNSSAKVARGLADLALARHLDRPKTPARHRKTTSSARGRRH